MNLVDLIAATRGDRSDPRLSLDAGGYPSRASWQKYRNGDILTFADPPTYAGMARALGVSPAVVLLSFGEQLGVDVGQHESPLIALMPPGTHRLTDQEVATVRGLILGLLAGHDAADEHARRVAKESRDVAKRPRAR